MTDNECWHGCGRTAVVRNPDGRARCRPCQKDHVGLVAAVLADMERRRRERRAREKAVARVERVIGKPF